MYPIPACFAYIKDTEDYLYSVLYQAVFMRYPDKKIQEDMLVETLRSSGRIPPDKAAFQRLETLNCFQISKEHHCHFICRICPYHPSYKNGKETEERLVLSYMLKKFSNTRQVLACGFQGSEFTALYFLMDKKPLFLPLYAFLYQYLSQRVDAHTDYGLLPQFFTKDLLQENPGKITDKNNYATIEMELIQLQKLPCPSSTLLPVLEGYSPMYASQFEIFQTQSGEMADAKKTAPVTGQTHRQQPTRGRKALVPDTKNKNQPTSENESVSLLAPLTFDVTSYPQIIPMEEGDPAIYQDWIGSPVIALELVTDRTTGQENFLICLRGTFYSVPADSGFFAAWLSQYGSISALRTVLSYDAYRLSRYFIARRLSVRPLFSLQAGFEVLQPASFLKSPSSVFQEVLSIEKDSLPFFLFAMPHYEAAWKQFVYQLNKKDGWKDWMARTVRNRMLGYSYWLSDYSDLNGTLFTRTTEESYRYHSLQPENLRYPYLYSSFIFRHNNEKVDLVDLVLQVISKEVLYRNRFYFLHADKKHLVLAVRKEWYSFVCEKINIIGTVLAEQNLCIPVIISIEMEYGGYIRKKTETKE